VVGFALCPAGLPLVVCLLLGSVVATTDPAAVIAVFRDVGAAARLTRLVEGEALLNDAAAIVMFTVLLGVIVSGQQPNLLVGEEQFLFPSSAARLWASWRGGRCCSSFLGHATIDWPKRR
jgi:CPA1 family monovalent cation:H+ antiporter